jgi:hypothetical protein
VFSFLAGVTFSLLDVQPRRLPDAPALVVINSTSEWAKFPLDTAPRIDFRKHTVVVIFAGERPTGGWSVRVRAIETRSKACAVRYAVVGPAPDAITTQAITHPYAVVLVKGKCNSATAQ